MKLALGTVQFGLDYGVNNQSGVTTDSELVETLALAHNNNIKLLDSATAYGNALERLGDLNPFPFDIVSKLKPILQPQITPQVIDDCLAEMEFSIKKAKVNKLYAIMFHSSKDLMKPGINNLVHELNQSGLCKKVGASFYSNDPICDLTDRLNLNIVQLPLSIADQTALQSGTLSNLKRNNCEVHIRSIFLQGLLLMEKKPDYFSQWSRWFELFKEACKKYNISPMQLCLSFVKNLPEVDKIVVGANNSAQLADIITNYELYNLNSAELSGLAINDPLLTNPANWQV